MQYLRPQAPRAAFLAVTLLVSTGLQLVNPQILRYFIDAATKGGTARSLSIAAILFMGVAIVQQLISIVSTYLSENVSWTATNALREDLTRHCLQLDMSFHKSRTPGEMIQRLDGDVGTLGGFFSQFLVGMLSNFLLMIGVLVVLWREDWRIGSSLTVFAVLVLFVLGGLRRVAVPHWLRSFQAGAEYYGFLEERLAGTEDVRASGATGYIMRRFHESLRNLFRKSVKSSLMGTLMGVTTGLSFMLAFGIGIGVGAYLFQHGVITIGTVFMIVSYVGVLQGPLQGITHQMSYFQQSTASVERIEEFMTTTSKIQDGSGATMPAGALSVDLEKVTFGYEKERVVLHDVSLRLEPGKILGLLGRTGSGKTTLTRLLFRLYDPDNGEIRLGGQSTRDARLADLRRRVCVVTQDVQLFNATVRDNLTFFDRTVSDQQLMQVLRELGLLEWIESLPKGLDTPLESSGSGLSAGEAQLLAFTRAFLKDPGLVILDEASSRLDPATEQLIERAVGRLLLGRTGIIVAHRLATVFRADDILILEEGRIREMGVRKQLAADHASRFYELLQTGMEEALA